MSQMNLEKLIDLARDGNLSKLELAKLLNPAVRDFYLSYCANLERLITEHCASKKEEHCLESGCPFTTEGVCTEACNRNDQFYAKSCAGIWIELFKNPNNRIDVWKKD